MIRPFRHAWLLLVLRIGFRLWLVHFLVFLSFSALPEMAIVQLGWVAADPAALAQARHRLGKELSITAEYLHYVKQLCHGDLGTTGSSHESVAKLVIHRSITSLPFVIGAFGLVSLFFLSGCLISPKYRVARLAVLISRFTAIPSFVVAVGTYSVWLLWLSPYLPQGFSAVKPSLVVLSLGLLPSTLAFLLAADAAWRWLHSDYFIATRAFGLSRSRQWLQLLIVVTHEKSRQASLTLTSILAGLPFVEPLFGIEGVGTLLMNSIRQNDFAVVQGIVFIAAILLVIVGSLCKE